jgi:replication factor C subunit 3/5
MIKSKKKLLWSEKYRPKKLDNIIGQDNIVNSIKKMLKNGSFPHMLFHGISGTGKTSVIMTIARELYGNNLTFMVMKLDASDDRGINSVREEIKGFAEKITIFNKGIKLIILDEADSMTFDAQFALRRIIEKYSDTTRFCLICNYENKIISPIKSRCANFRFQPIKEKYLVQRLDKISKKEKIKIDNKSLNIIANLAKGDFRKGINLLQSVSLRSDNINEEVCYNISGIPPVKVINKIFRYLINDKYDFDKVYKLFKKNLTNSYSVSIILKELISRIILNIDNFEDKKLAKITSELSDLESKVSNSTFGDIYLTSIISIFKSN